jgi:predicted Zn-dependent peptidase
MTVAVSQLSNGLVVASDTMPGVETVSMGAWISAGTRHEAAAVNGIAHLLEHMAFKGTERRSAYQIAAEIEAVGGYLNAYTTREATAYYAKVLAGDLGLAVDIVGDILQHPLFEEDELTRERNVVLQEIGQAHDTPDDIIFDHFQEAAYPDQPLGRPVLGEAGIVCELRRQDLFDYMDRNYGPRRMVVAAAGAVEHAAFLDLVERTFDGLTADDGAELQAAKYKGGEARQERDLEQVHLLIGFPSFGYLDSDYYAVNLLSTLLGGGMSSRLYQEVREKQGLAYSIYSFNYPFMDCGLFGIYAGTGEDMAATLLEIVVKELHGLAPSLGDEEVARAKMQTEAAYRMSRESTTARCEQLAQQILTYGRPQLPQEILGRIAGVSKTDLRDLCGKLFGSDPTFVSMGPVTGFSGLTDLRSSIV